MNKINISYDLSCFILKSAAQTYYNIKTKYWNYRNKKVTKQVRTLHKI